MLTFTDQTGSEIFLKNKAARIVSLVPSQSELLWDLGLREELAGITKFCIHPGEMFQTVTRIGGTKSVNIEKIRKLNPDLIIANKEENEKAQIEELKKYFPVWISDIITPEDSLEMISKLGALVNKEHEAKVICDKIQQGFSEIKNSIHKRPVAYFIWKDPFMLAGSNTFIHSILELTGLKNSADHLSRYPVLSLKELQDLNPEYCFLSSEPYPFSEKHIEEMQNIFPDSKIKIVDGEMFSWYGSRMLQLPAYIKKLKSEIEF